MKLIRMLRRSIRDAFKSVIRNFSLSIASISCISITLIVVAFSIILSKNVENFDKIIKEDVTVVVFLNRDIDEEGLKTFEAELKKDDNVAESVYKSKEEQRQEMMKESDIFNSIMGSWEEKDNPLKDSYLIKVKDLLKIEDTVNRIKKLDNVEIVNWGEGMVSKLVKTFDLIEKVCFSIVIILILVTVFLILNTIKLTIFSRKREISIMRLVGASNFTIKNPFIIEGMILGVLGSIFPIGLMIYVYDTFYKHFNGKIFSDLIKLIKPYPFVFEVAVLIVILGILVGMIGSSRAVRKYLKV